MSLSYYGQMREDDGAFACIGEKHYVESDTIE